MNKYPERQIKRIKITISGSLFVYATVLAVIARSPACTLAALAMAVSALGDALLAGYPGCLAGVRNKLVKGGLAFFAAHILYIRALVVSAGEGMNAFLVRSVPSLALFLLITVLHGAVFYFRPRSSSPRLLLFAAFVYLLTVGVHAALAVTLCVLPGGWYVLYAAGALLFYVSDAALLARRYGSLRGRRIPALIWGTYVPAQFCLLTGLFLQSFAGKLPG